MHIAVTGAAGRIGRYIIQDLRAAGHSVQAMDITAHSGLQVDLTDAGQVYGALSGCEAVVHMGAWANAGMVPDTRTYGDNVTGTYNVFQACADLGIKRVVSASSNQIYGFFAAAPDYVLVDEVHPVRPINSYALSKVAGEAAADYFVRNRGLEILSFRIMGARVPAQIPADIAAIKADPAAAANLLWTRSDARDIALACRLAIEADAVESGAYNITGSRIVLDVETRTLLGKYCPQTQICEELQGFDSPLSCAKARRVFGFEPRYAWSESNYYLEEEV
ncbi:MAG: NAD-dependent epimerase/dehydratase family protein [Candidatus Latescibacterota bacterium]|jgi:nucleoside-diphosphate-sugar epimerase